MILKGVYSESSCAGMAVRRTASLPLAHDPRIDLKNKSRFKKMDCRGIRAFTPVFDGLCPAMTISFSSKQETP